MSWITTTDPLALLAIQAGQINTPSPGGAAKASTDLDSPQRFIRIGEPVPIVFARFRNSKGGILISPGASEARFENDASNNVTAYYHLPLSEGQIDSISVKDVFQQACRVGGHTQTYDRRAGTWAPGNYIVQRAGYDLPAAPYFCGSVGLYPNISTLSFNVTIPDGFDQYNRQVHLFIRGGMHVTRIYDSVTGPSDNFADLVKWLLINTSRVPGAMIDNAALLSAATFLEYNGFTCNCELRESTNYADLAAEWAPYFLLGESNNGGKKGLRPLLPVTAAGQIKTTAITPEYVFTDDTVIAGSVEIDYLSLADRLPFVAQVIWRQQLESNVGIIRTAEVRYTGTAENGPYETHDLSAFCTSEDHAVKVATYILAKRVYPTHSIRFSARPQAHTTIITVGDIVAVILARDATNGVASNHSYLYQIERITKTLAGDVSYEATHFPTDAQSRSLIALDVAAASGTGIVLASNRTGISCDINPGGGEGGDNIPAEEFIEQGDANDPETSPGDFELVVIITDDDGGIIDVSITDPGSGLTDGEYTGIDIGPDAGLGGGVDAEGDATVIGGELIDFIVTDPGSGFTEGQIVTPIPSTNGTGAAGTSSPIGIGPSGSGGGFAGVTYTGSTENPDDGQDSGANAPIPIDNPTGQAGATPGAIGTPPNTCSGAPIVGWFDQNGVINITNIPANYPSLVLTKNNVGQVIYGTIDCNDGTGIITYGPINTTEPALDLSKLFISTVNVKYIRADGTEFGAKFTVWSYGQPSWRSGPVMIGGTLRYQWLGYNISGNIVQIANTSVNQPGAITPAIFYGGNTTDGSKVTEIRDATTNAVIYTYPT